MAREAFEHSEIFRELRGLPRKELREVIDFIGYLKARRARKRLVVEGGEDLASVCGLLEGPPDMADRHDHYLYGLKG